MNSNRYCKACGSQVDFQYGEPTAHCPICDKDIERKDAIAGFKRDARITQLKAMHTLMLEANDEGIYISWIYTMPDCPSDEDFESIAIDDKQYNECFDKFVRLIAMDGNRY